MKGIVDRIENGIATVETDNGMLDVRAVDDLQCGDIVEITDGVICSIDRAAAQARRARLQQRLDRMRGR